MRILKYISILMAVTAVIFYFVREKNPYQIITGKTMGTYYTVKISSNQENKLLSKYISEELKLINAEMSVFEKSSEISKINKSPAGEWIDLSEPMQYLMKSAYSNYTLSRGAFDPTVSPLVDLWGFGTTKPKKIPSDENIKETLKNIGFSKLRFTSTFDRIRKENDEINLNLSAIAKGYGVDRVTELLKKMGYQNFVVEIGGEVYAAGEKSKETKGWTVGVVYPEGDYSKIEFTVTLKNMAVATSGDYRNFVYIDEKKYSHTISPQTGYPVDSNLISATVFDESCMEADAMATALMVMGDKKAAEFANKNNIVAILFSRDENKKINSFISNRAKKLLGL